MSLMHTASVKRFLVKAKRQRKRMPRENLLIKKLIVLGGDHTNLCAELTRSLESYEISLDNFSANSLQVLAGKALLYRLFEIIHLFILHTDFPQIQLSDIRVINIHKRAISECSP